MHINFQLREKDYTHPFYVIENSSSNWIIGCDFLKKHNARNYFDLENLRLGKEYVNLDQDVHVASVERLEQDVTIPPQSRAHAIGKLKPRSYYKSGMLCEVDQGEKSCIRDEPGLFLANSLSKLDDKCRCQLSIINSTTKTYSLKRGCVMGKMSIVEDIDVQTLAEVVKSTAAIRKMKHGKAVVISSHVDHLRLAKADWPDPIVTSNTDRLRRNRLAVSDSSDHGDQSEYGSGLAPSEVVGIFSC